jgi:aldehyde:ferredoxin oxidoreductase
MRGYTGKILLVDLTSRTWEEQTIPDEVYEQYLSGVGLAAYVTYQHMPPGAEALGPDNLLGFVTGILTGTGALFGGRWMVTGKSPLTGGWGDANCGGDFGPAIKQCGFDGIFFKGIAGEPVYLFADGEKVEIRSAAHLWGMDATEAQACLKAEVGSRRRPRVASIGMAGEKLSLVSGICNDGGRLAGRSGLGAVMGSKRLKALVLAGSKPIRSADSAELKRLTKACNAYVPKGDFRFPAWVFPILYRLLAARKTAMRTDGMLGVAAFRKWGTTTLNQIGIVTGDTPVKNWGGSRGDYPLAPVNPDRVLRRTPRQYHCINCPLGCGATGSGTDGAETHRPEYETSSTFGSLLLNKDLDSIFTINELLNRAGMDSISAGVIVAFAIECFESGILTEKDTGGLQLSWGNTPAILTLVKQMIAREGLGDLLADGVKVAAEKLGPAAESYAMHAGGQELPMHDPRQDPGYGVHYVVEPTPGRHTVGSWGTYETLRLWTKVSWAPEAPRSYPAGQRYEASEKNGIYAAACSMAKMVVDGAGLCTFGLLMGVDRLPVYDYLNAAAGWQKTPDDYMEIGRRIQTLRQCFNIREGLQPADVHLPGRSTGGSPVRSGPHKGRHVPVDELRRIYWQVIGWDKDTGIPLPETLQDLGLPQLSTIDGQHEG